MRRQTDFGKFVVAALIGLFALAAVTPAWAQAQSRRPNIVVVLTDDQGWGDVGYQGVNKIVKTPHLDAMASAGLRFNRCYSASAWCSPTRAGLLSGRHPSRFGNFVPQDTLPPGENSLARILRNAGYRTGHFGKWHLGGLDQKSKTSPGAHGFETWFSIYNSYMVPRNDVIGFVRDGKSVGKTKGYAEDVVMDEALAFIQRSVNDKQPFFAFICHLAPHDPYDANDRLRAHYPRLDAKEQNYWGMISSIDENLGKLRKALRDLGVADDTLVIFTSDNGGTRISNRHTPLSGNKATIWEGGLRVPGIAEWPSRIPRPFQSDIPVYTCDILPTALEAAGVALPKDSRPIDGLSLMPLFEGKWKSRPEPIVIHFDDYPRSKGKSNEFGKTGFVVIDNQWTLMTDLVGKNAKLFDVPQDIGEKADQFKMNPAIAERLETVRRRWWDVVQAEPSYIPANAVRSKKVE